MMMNNNNFNIEWLKAVFDFISALFIYIVRKFFFYVYFITKLVLSDLFAFYDWLFRFLYGNRDADRVLPPPALLTEVALESLSFFGVFINVFFSYFFVFYQIFLKFKAVKRSVYFFFFISLYYWILDIELSNESLLLTCIFFTMFLLYSSFRDLIISSIETDVFSIKKLLEKKLALLENIYNLEREIFVQSTLTIEILESALVCLSQLDNETIDIEEAFFDNSLNFSFSESLFNYFFIELKDEFFMDYFIFEDQFEETLNLYLDSTTIELC